MGTGEALESGVTDCAEGGAVVRTVVGTVVGALHCGYFSVRLGAEELSAEPASGLEPFVEYLVKYPNFSEDSDACLLVLGVCPHRQRVRRERAAEEVSLQKVATQPSKLFALGTFFDPFRYDLQSEGVSNLDD
jgi:hypothetical protein